MKKCKKCLKEKTINSFCEFIAITKNGNIKRRRDICYECNYKNIKRNIFQWNNASDVEILKHIEKGFNKMVIKQKGCWDWKGFIRGDGYTRMRFGSSRTSVGGHVVSWMLKHKRLIKKGECVLHKCDNRKCTNPKHLYLGTYKDNMIDMVKRQRHPHIKLNLQKVKNIKKLLQLDVPISVIARKYKVHRRTITDIYEKRTWKYV